MCPSEKDNTDGTIHGRAFQTTHWSIVLAAGGNNSVEAQTALAELCRTYWYPLYAFVRHRGYSVHDAKDLTQDYFVWLMEKERIAIADREKGKFRSFLLFCLKNFLEDQRDRRQALKRGGKALILSLDEITAESKYSEEPANHLSGEKLFERNWAMTVLEQAEERLRQEYAVSGKANVFDSLRECLTGERGSMPYKELAERLESSEGAIRVAVHRMRQRYRQVLREEIGRTVETPNEIDDEIRNLMSALSGG